MILAKILSISLCMGVGSLAFADDPPPPTSTPPAATAAPATADAASTVAADKAAADKAKSAAKTATGPGGVTLDQAKTLRSAGYKANVQKDGQGYYCRSEPKMGSLFETKVCDTAENIMLSIASSKDAVSQMQRTPTNVRTN
jgi:hypothetical protein